MSPLGFSNDTSLDSISCPNGARHRIGVKPLFSTAGSHTPPIPSPHASCGPTAIGWSGTNSAMCTAHQVSCDVFKIIELVVYSRCDAHTPLVSVPQARLQQTKKSPAPRYANSHAAELSQKILPLANANTFASAEVIKDLAQTLPAMLWQLNRPSDGVHRPSENFFPR